MIFDVSNVSNYGDILLIVFAALLLIGFLKGFAKGFWKSVVSFLLWIGVIVVVVMFSANIGAQLQTMGLLESLISSFGDSEVSKLLTGLIGPTAYTIIAALAIIIVGAIIIGLLNVIARSLFRKKGFFSRLIGALWGLLFNGVIATVLLVLLSSPLLLKGSDKAVRENQYLAMYQDNVVVKVQEVLEQNNLPSTVDDLVLIALNQDLNEENRTRIGNISELMSDSEAYLNALVNPDNTVNQPKAKEAYKDIVFFAKVVNDMEAGATKDALKAPLEATLKAYTDGLIVGGNQPLATVTVDEADYNAMNSYMDSLSLDEELQSKVNLIFVK